MNTNSLNVTMGEKGQDHEGAAGKHHRTETAMLGPISRLAPHNELWSGNISRNQQDVERVSTAIKTIPDYFIEVDPEAPERCIDGRPKVIKGAQGNRRELHLGPQTPGGTPAMTLAYRIMNAHKLPEGRKFCDDLTETIKLCKRHGISFGGHIDNHNHGMNCGCGAIDKIPDIFQKMLAPGFTQAVSVYLKAMLGERFDEGVVQNLLEQSAALSERNGEYLERDLDGEFLYRKRVIETLEAEATDVQPVEQLQGDHREVALVVNLVPGTTFNRDHFTASQDFEVQAFNYDFWVSEEFAQKLFTTEKKRTEFLTIRAMLGIATAMVLTDGSLELILRTSK